MGATYTVSFMAGLPANKVFEEKKTTEIVTKFDEDSGKPYKKEITNDEGLFFGKTPISEEYDVEKKGLTFATSGEGSSWETSCVGVLIFDSKDLNYNQGMFPVSEEEITKAIKKANDIFKQHGIKENAKLFYVNSVSC